MNYLNISENHCILTTIRFLLVSSIHVWRADTDGDDDGALLRSQT
jgi:hypothetical protein